MPKNVQTTTHLHSGPVLICKWEIDLGAVSEFKGQQRRRQYNYVKFKNKIKLTEKKNKNKD